MASSEFDNLSIKIKLCSVQIFVSYWRRICAHVKVEIPRFCSIEVASTGAGSGGQKCEGDALLLPETLQLVY